MKNLLGDDRGKSEYTPAHKISEKKRGEAGQNREGKPQMAKSVRSKIRESLMDQLREKLVAETVPKELEDRVKGYLALYDQFWAIGAAMAAPRLDTKTYLDLSKERRQVNASMLSILKLFNDIRGRDDCYIDVSDLEG